MRNIIGYRLIKPEYESVAAKIAGFNDGKLSIIHDDINFQHGSPTYESLNKAGVVDLWFETVYKKDEVRDALIDFFKHHGIFFWDINTTIEEAVDKYLNLKK